ncbi:MAG: UbiA family prenyltransferase [Methanomassiliicoccales archaeon]|nr:UbiA family prenyltransferase [Methanomassiliicoccales archaeon]
MTRGQEGATIEERLGHKIDSFVLYLERNRLSILTIFLYVVLIALLRDLSEYFLLDQEFVTTSHPWIFSIAHHVSFFVVTFLGLVLLLSAFTQRSVRKIVNFICTFWWIIILPPWIDHYISGLDHNYEYFSPTDFIDALLHFSGKGFHIGQATEVVIILFALFAYGIWTQRSNLYSVAGRVTTGLRVFFLVLFTLMTMFILATPGLYLPVGSVDGVPVFPAFDLTKYYQYHLFLVMYYLLMGVALVLAIGYLNTRGRFLDILRSMRLPQTLFFSIIVGAGIVAGWKYSGGLYLATRILETPFWVNLSFAVIAMVSAIMAWQVGTMWNDISDRGTDEPTRRKRTLASGMISTRTYLEFSLVLVLVCLALSALLSPQQFLVLAIILVLAWTYSFKPIRLKENVMSPMLMGLGTFLALLYGALTPYSEVLFIEGNPPVPYLTGSVIFPSLGPESLLLGFFVFAGLVVGSIIMDIEGYEEDLKGGVKTVYTTLGLEGGKKVVSALIFIASLLPLALFDEPHDVIVFPALGIAAACLFWKYGKPSQVMLLSFIGLVYAALRYLNLI